MGLHPCTGSRPVLCRLEDEIFTWTLNSVQFPLWIHLDKSLGSTSLGPVHIPEPFSTENDPFGSVVLSSFEVTYISPLSLLNVNVCNVKESPYY